MTVRRKKIKISNLKAGNDALDDETLNSKQEKLEALTDIKHGSLKSKKQRYRIGSMRKFQLNKVRSKNLCAQGQSMQFKYSIIDLATTNRHE